MYIGLLSGLRIQIDESFKELCLKQKDPAQPLSSVEIENRAEIARITCGWKKKHLSLDVVRRYWRDVHSPAISRRSGLYEYRHHQYDPVESDLFLLTDDINFDCKSSEQLMWLSDVRYRNQAGLDAFGCSPDSGVKNFLLADIELIVDKSSTYKAVGKDAITYLDITGDPTPQGAPAAASYSIFFRQNSDERRLHECARMLAQLWTTKPGIQRVRLNIFEAPDIEAEKRAGYPIKTHPKEMQYQALIELVMSDRSNAKALLLPSDNIDFAAIGEIHAYPVFATYTSVYAGLPTLVGLRGYPAFDAIRSLASRNQQEISLLKWMYGDIAKDGFAGGLS